MTIERGREEVLLEADSRRRVSLGRLGVSERDRYLARVEDGGTIVLTPAAVVSELEARFLADPQLVQRIRESAERPEAFVRYERRPKA